MARSSGHAAFAALLRSVFSGPHQIQRARYGGGTPRGACAVRPGSRASCGQSLSPIADAEKPDSRLNERNRIATREGRFITDIENLPCNSGDGQERLAGG